MKRLFFGVEVSAPWPETAPTGRILQPEMRHMTLAFLGDVDEEAALQIQLPDLPFGGVGFLNKILFLPPRKSHVVAYHAKLFDHKLQEIQKWLQEQLTGLHYKIDTRPFLPHVTVARSPFDSKGWKKSFQPLPFFWHKIHLYESVGNLTYIPILTKKYLPPFEEISHTADLAFLIRGENHQALFYHALAALVFHHPPLLAHVEEENPENLDQVIQSLNRVLSRADAAAGVPFKAVSYHGTYHNQEWEMIVDV